MNGLFKTILHLGGVVLEILVMFGPIIFLNLQEIYGNSFLPIYGWIIYPYIFGGICSRLLRKSY